MRDVSDGLNVNQRGVGVADGLDKNHARIVPNRRLENVNALGRVDERGFDTEVGQRVFKEIERSAVNGGRRDDVLPFVRESLRNVGDCRRARSYCQSRRAAFKSRNAFFQDVLRRIRQTPVNVAGVAKSETIRRVLAVVEDHPAHKFKMTQKILSKKFLSTKKRRKVARSSP